MRRRTSAPPRFEPLEGRALLSTAHVDLGGNHTARTAQSVRISSDVGRATVLGRVDDSGLQDVYRLSPSKPGTFRLSLGEMGVNPVKVEIVSRSGRSIGHIDAPDGFAETTIRLKTAEPVYLLARGVGHGIGVYQITLEQTGPGHPAPTFQPGPGAILIRGGGAGA